MFVHVRAGTSLVQKRALNTPGAAVTSGCKKLVNAVFLSYGGIFCCPSVCLSITVHLRTHTCSSLFFILGKVWLITQAGLNSAVMLLLSILSTGITAVNPHSRLALYLMFPDCIWPLKPQKTRAQRWETTTFDIVEWRAEYLSCSPSHPMSCMLPFLGFSLLVLSLWQAESTVYVAGKTNILTLLHTHAPFPNKMPQPPAAVRKGRGRFGAFQLGSTCLTSVWFSVSRRPTF